MSSIINKQAFKTYLMLVVPLMLQNLVTSSVSLLDNLMIGRLGEVELAGVAMANKVFFVYNLMVFGICSGATVFFSQFWGKQDKKGIRAVMTVGLCLSIGFGAVFTLAAGLFPTSLMKLLAGRNLEIIPGGAAYLRISCLGYILFSLTFILGTGLKAIERPTIPLLGSVTSLAVNGVLNYILIFGKLGLPALGVRGAAIATVSARLLELGVVLFGMAGHRGLFFAPIKEAFSFPEGFLHGYMRTSMPVFINETIWGLGITVYGAVLARLGSGPAAAHSIVGTVESMLFAVVFGTATAAGVIVGKEIGSGRRDAALQKTKFYQGIAVVQGLVIGIALFAAAPAITGFFKMTPDTRAICIAMLRICACFMAFKALSTVSIVGTMRSGGDTIFCMISDAGGVWFIGVPLVTISGLVLGLPAPIVLGSSYIEEVVKCIAVLVRQRNDKWMKDLVN
ncbi:MAG: MATE family efflux transporter [Oscillospiraceae bacterium]|nr:MATE family efflux transporter [Oscillospiraceae bacterium]